MNMMICMIALTLFANVNECSPAVVPDDTPMTLSSRMPGVHQALVLQHRRYKLPIRN